MRASMGMISEIKFIIMSTRANIIIKDNHEKLYFYRHSDGYEDGVMPSLNIFLNWVKEGKIRDNVSQAAGWLILLGAIEYGTIPKFETEKSQFDWQKDYGDLDTIIPPNNWKVGAYEPTTGIHGDIEYLYVIDLVSKKIEVITDNFDNY